MPIRYILNIKEEDIYKIRNQKHKKVSNYIYSKKC